MQEETKAVAGAVEAVANTSGKVVDMMQQFGGFISEYTHEPLKAASGIVTNKLNYIRWEQGIRLMVKSRELLIQLGFSSPPHAVPMNFAIPLLEAGSLEENGDLQDLWAALLVNAATSGQPNDRRRAYISILEQLTHLDAQILIKIYTALAGEVSERAAITKDLPERIEIFPRDGSFDSLESPSEDVVLSLANLARIGCIDSEEDWGNRKDFRVAYGTILGKAFFESVTLRRP